MDEESRRSFLRSAVEKWPDVVNGDDALLNRGRHVTVDFMIELGAVPYYVSIVRGRMAELVRGPLLMRSWCFAVRGSESGWYEFWQPLPRPTFHDIFALTKINGFRIEGDLRPFMTNLLYFKLLLQAPARAAARTP